MRRLRALLAIAAAGLALLGNSAVADPALWVAKGPNATIYLFGTIHILSKDRNWRTPALTEALGKSDELWLEVADIDDNSADQALVKRYGIDAEHPLSTQISASDLARVDAAAKSLGLPGEKPLEPMRPWLASVTLAGVFLAHAGFDPENGVERILLHDDWPAGKPVRGFETVDQQLHFFADMAPALQVSMLESMLQDLDEGPGKLDEIVRAWREGDEAKLTRLVVDEMKRPFPQLYRTLFLRRNKAWADRIATMVKGSGVSFIAVGAGHLAGPDSVQNQLKKRGVRVDRILPRP